MYWHSSSRKELSLPSDPKLRKAIIEASDKAQSMSLKDAAYERRKILKRIRFEKLAERSDLVQKSKGEFNAVTLNMNRRINEL